MDSVSLPSVAMHTIASAGRIEARGIDQYQQVVPPWDLFLRQMSPGRFEADVEYVQINGILLYRERWSSRVLATGSTPEGFFVFGGPCSSQTPIRWCGSELNSRRPAFSRSCTEVDFVAPESSHHLTLMVPERLMLRYLGEELAALVSGGGFFLQCQTGCGVQLLNMTDRLIDKYRFRPDLLAEDRVCKAIERRLLGSLVELLAIGGIDSVCRPPRSRYLAVRRAIDYCDDLQHPVTVPELAAAAGVSKRVLELGFQETAGTPPRTFMRWNRMNQVRRALLDAEGCSSSVTQIAGNWGISEFGRFAVEYKKLFGESPSATLARRSGSNPKRLADALLESSHTREPLPGVQIGRLDPKKNRCEPLCRP